MMKIEIWYKIRTVYGDIREYSRIVRVPPNIKQINSKTCLEIMYNWSHRVNSIIHYLDKQHSLKKGLVNHHHINNITSSIKIKGWSLVIDVDVLEFICSRL